MVREGVAVQGTTARRFPASRHARGPAGRLPGGGRRRRRGSPSCAWWEILGTLRLGIVICLTAGVGAPGSGAAPLGRAGRDRPPGTAEQEWDLLLLLRPGADAADRNGRCVIPAAAAILGAGSEGPARGRRYGRPTASELLEAVKKREYLTRQVQCLVRTTGQHRVPRQGRRQRAGDRLARESGTSARTPLPA